MSRSKISSVIKGPGLLGEPARHEYRSLFHWQPLVLQREPSNRVDPNAVIAMTARLRPCGYVSKAAAALIAPDLDAGILWLCRVTHPATAFSNPKIILWRPKGLAKDFEAALRESGASESVARAVLRGEYVKEAEAA